MSAASNTAAYQEIVAKIRTIANGAPMVALLGSALTLQYQQVLLVKPQGSGRPFARLTVQNTSEKKRTLSVPSRVTKQGLVNIQLLMPENMASVAEKGYATADLLEKALQGSTANVYFQRSFIKALPPAESMFVWRISSNYNYDVMEG